MNKSIIVYGPQGCGKTRYAERMRKHFGLSSVVDDFDPVRTGIILYGMLYLTSDMRTPQIRAGNTIIGMVFHFSDVAQQINAAIPLTALQRGEPERIGEYIATTGVSQDTRRWWNGERWSTWYFEHDSPATKNKAAKTQSIWLNGAITWRGLAEEPIMVQA